MVPVILESPYAGTPDVVELNLAYLRDAMHDCLMRGEAPFASHGLYTQPGVLDDRNEVERKLGIAAGFAWRVVAAKTVVYCDRGVTPGMIKGIQHALDKGHTVEMRSLVKWRTSP